MRDIRAALEHADDPCHDKLDKCFRHHGQDPAECGQCNGDPRFCAEIQANGYRPEMPETDYAFMLSSYIEAFRPDPADVSWRDLEIYQALQMARNQHQRKKFKRDHGN